jgi:large subunit ribosomal protein L21
MPAGGRIKYREGWRILLTKRFILSISFVLTSAKDKDMYAIIKTGAKQHKVSEGDVLSVEKLPGDKGAEVVFQEVLMVSDEAGVKIGRPFVEGATVIGEVVSQTKGPKLLIGKYKKRKGFRKKTGHRQELTSMKIKKISI